MHQQMFVRIGGLVLAGGASFLYVKKVLTNRRKRREDNDRLQEHPNERASQYVQHPLKRRQINSVHESRELSVVLLHRCQLSILHPSDFHIWNRRSCIQLSCNTFQHEQVAMTPVFFSRCPRSLTCPLSKSGYPASHSPRLAYTTTTGILARCDSALRPCVDMCITPHCYGS
ncbi:hypothetical protein EV363DRAFT_655642 [Boletus edulis]|nr:hypothetical protein EV363DRAFT_655642 [Boletus edulis]